MPLSLFCAITPMKIPCARAPSGALCFADTAPRGDYACLCCHSQVILKRGKVKVPHFAHKTLSACEGTRHKYTKEWIASLATDPAFEVQSQCPLCCAYHEVFRGHLACKSFVEHRLGDYVVDCLIRKDATRFFVEVRDTHAAGGEKMRWLEGRGTAFEVRAVDLIKTKYPRSFLTIDRRACPPCLQKLLTARRDDSARKRAKATQRAALLWRTHKERRAAAFLRRFALRWRLLTRVRQCHKHALSVCKLERSECECGRWVETLCLKCFVVCDCGQVERIVDGCPTRRRRACLVCGEWCRRADMFPVGKSYVCSCAPQCTVCERRMISSDYGGKCRACNIAAHDAMCACGRGFVYVYGRCYTCQASLT